MTVKCSDIEECLSAYLDRELTLQEESAVREHLQLCKSCRLVLEDLRHIQALVRGLKRVAVPDSLRLSLERRLDGIRKPPVPFMVFVSRGLAGLAASAVLLAGFITLLGYVAPERVTLRESSLYQGAQAYHLMRQPLMDRSSWSYVSGNNNFELLASED